MSSGAVAGTAGSLGASRPLGVAGGLRLARALLATAGAVAGLRTGRDRKHVLQDWSTLVLGALRVDVELARPIPQGAALWAANHLSWLDPLVLLNLRPAGVLAKREVAGYPLIGAAAARAGLRFVDRMEPLSRAAALAGVASDLRRGEPFLLFPEGTTTRGHHLGRVHAGGLLAAHRLGVPTLPVRLDCAAPHYPWTGDAQLLLHLRELAAAPPVQVRITPGPCLHPRDWSDPYEWLSAVRRHLAPHQPAEPESPI